jgi:hypothetical protein
VQRRTTTEWMAAALCVALAIVLAVRVWGPPGDKLTLPCASFWLQVPGALALLSIRRVSAMLHPTIWRLVRTVGVEYISYAFMKYDVNNIL